MLSYPEIVSVKAEFIYRDAAEEPLDGHHGDVDVLSRGWEEGSVSGKRGIKLLLPPPFEDYRVYVHQLCRVPSVGENLF